MERLRVKADILGAVEARRGERASGLVWVGEVREALGAPRGFDQALEELCDAGAVYLARYDGPVYRLTPAQRDGVLVGGGCRREMVGLR